jgi:addiction module HigA family antidote
MTEIARSLGISRQLLYSIVNEQAPITPEVAVRLGKLVGNGPEIWVNMQAAFDLWHAEREVDVSRVPTLAPPEAAE